MKPTRERIGEIGETLAAKLFEHNGHSVILNDDQYDAEKDMVVDGKNVEIKTQTLYRLFPCEDGTKKPAFTVPISHGTSNRVYTNQLNKCLTVDRLVFVSRPGKSDRTIRFYEAAVPGKRKFQLTINKRDGRIVAGFLLSELKEIAECTDKTAIKELMDEWR